MTAVDAGFSRFLYFSSGLEEKMSIKEFAKPSLLRPLAISMALHFFQQSTGINAVMFYCATIFQTAGFQDNSTMVAILIGLIQFLAAIVALIIIDRGGRRFLLIIGGTGMFISCFTMGAYFFVTINAAPAYEGLDISWVAVTSVAIYIVGFAMSWGPCTWLIMSEIFPVKARGTASGIATACNWLFSFAITKSFTLLIKSFTAAGTFWFYGSLMVLGTVFVYFYLPETKGKSLEEIQKYFESKETKTKTEKTETNRFIYITVPEVTGKSLYEIHQYFESKAKKATGFVYVCVTESKGKSLGQIQKYFESKGKNTTVQIVELLRESDV